jgi:hypothetical protein
MIVLLLLLMGIWNFRAAAATQFVAVSFVVM